MLGYEYLVNGEWLKLVDIKDCLMLEGTCWEGVFGNVYFFEGGTEVHQDDITEVRKAI